MTPRVLNDPVLGQAERAMDLLARRQTALAANLANIDTPGYQTVDLSFEQIYKSELEAKKPAAAALVETSPGHFAAMPSPGEPGSAKRAEPRLETVPGLTPRPDGNNVHLDREILAMHGNKFLFNVAAQMALTRIRTLRAAITDGRS